MHLIRVVVAAWMATFLQGCTYTQMYMAVHYPSPLCQAIGSGDFDRAMQLVDRGEDVNARSGCALLRAAERGQLKLVKQLLDHGADPNRYISLELTPLKGAVESRDVEVVRTLLDKGADPRDDINAFQVVLNLGNVEMAELLLRHGANANMSYSAEGPVDGMVEIRPREWQYVEVPRRDLQPDRIDDTAKRLQCKMSTLSWGTSLLFLAVQGRRGPGPDNREQIVKLLLGHGADPNAKTINGTTPLMWAASGHDHRVMTALMDAGADVNAKDRCGHTAADHAALNPRSADLAPQTKALLQERQGK